MSNRRPILFFLAGLAVCAALLWALAGRECGPAPALPPALCRLDAAAVDALSVARGGARTLLVKDARGWRLVAPYAAAADAAPVARLLDVATLVPPEDVRTAADLARLGCTFADFGLDRPRATVTVCAGARTNVLHFGAATPSGAETYVRTGGGRDVYTLPAAAFAAVPADADAFRPRALFTCPRDLLAGLEFRAPDAPFVKLARVRDAWRLVAPSDAPADEAAVRALIDRLLSARIADFVLPSARTPPPAGAPGPLPTASLAPYGLSPDAALSVTLRAADGTAETVAFGAAAGTNRVWALVCGGAAVVTADAALADLCRARDASLRDTRVFAVAPDETLKSVSLTVGSLVYVLARGDGGAWRLDAPVAAPADPARAAALVERILTLKQNDVAADDAADAPVRVTLATSAGNRSGVTVPAAVFGGAAAFADLRSKTLAAVDPASVRRLSVKTASGETPVVYDPDRAVWNLEKPVAGRRASPTAIQALLAALTRVEAVRVETVAALPADFARCGLAAPACTVTVDADAAEGARRNILIGGDAPDGGRYATAGGADAVFVISRATAAALSAPLAE